jgi:putative MATE family efflux protein
MWGWGQGVIGAATASANAFAVGGILITIALMRHKTISPRGDSLKPDGAVLRPCFKVALPNLFQGIATSLGYVVFASMINSVGDTATAAHTVANTVESAFYIPGFGMKTAASTLAGNAYGAKDNKKMKELARMFIPIEIFLMIISGAALFIFAPALVGLFSKSDEVIRLGATVLRMVALSEPFYGFSIIMEGFLVGVGKTKTPFLYTLIGMWGVRIVGTFILINLMGYGLVAAWGAMIAHNMLLFVLYLVCYLKGKWNPLNVK